MPVYEYYRDKCKRDVRVTLSTGESKRDYRIKVNSLIPGFRTALPRTFALPLPRDQLRLTLSVQIFSYRNNLTRADVPQNAF